MMSRRNFMKGCSLGLPGFGAAAPAAVELLTRREYRKPYLMPEV